MSDPYSLARFVAAQADVIDAARAELAAGRKRSHWMWFVFPQLKGLGVSATSERYGISGLAEARAYLAHPALGPRLRECAQLALDSGAPDARALFGTPDDLKFRSSMTLFAAACPEDAVFEEALRRFYGGEGCTATLARLGG